MKGQTVRRDVLRAVGTVTFGASSVSIVSADSNGSGEEANAYRLPDLSVRSYLEESRDVEFGLVDQNSGVLMATRVVSIDHTRNGELPEPRDFDFEIPTGRFRLFVASKDELLAEETFTAPIGGFPDHRGFAVAFGRDSVELSEHYI